MDGLGLAAPGELCLDGNLAENWRKWKRNFQNYLVAINLIAQPAGNDGAWPPANGAIWLRQIAILKHCIGEEAVEILDQFEFDGEAEPAEDENRLPDVLAKFEGYFNPRRNLLYEWYVFMSMNQSDGEPIDMFVKRLKTQASKCEFEGQRDMMILVRCVFGIKDRRLKEKLLQDGNVNLARAIDLIRASEVTKTQLAEISDERSVSVVKYEEKPSTKDTPIPALRKITDCRFCGYDHIKGKCYAYGKDCRACGGKNHFRSKCTKKEVNAVSCRSSSMNMNELFVGMISSKCESTRGWFKSYNLCCGQKSKIVNFKIDTGAEANVLPVSHAKDLGAVIERSDTRLRSYSGDLLPSGGKTWLWLDQDNVTKLEFELVNADVVPVLGLEACVGLGIVRRVDNLNNQAILDEFADCFEGIGCFEREHTIRVNPEVKPVINRARRIPISRVEKVKAELDKMEANGIIEKVDQPTEWVNSMVVVEKRDGSVRICLDPKELNKAVMREHHHIPTLEDISFKFSDMSVFTIVDMKSGYWHVPLDRSSQLLTTFNTPFGRFCYRRLPFGINSSAEVFEKRVEEVFGDLDVSIYFDDIIIAGKDQEDHDRKLRKLLQRAREVNVKFNREKIQHNCSEVTYLGHIVSKDGLKPDPEKVKAIDQMPDPTDREGIQRLIGSLNFLRSYIPNVSKVTQPVRELLKADAAWTWGPDQKEAMKNIKAILMNEPVLKYFNVNKKIVLQTDASQGGLGAVLLQDNQPVAYASRALNDAEQRYPQIDKELLAIVYGCEKFHTYTYGRDIDVQTDHQPLVSIVKKPLMMASPRLQKLLIRLQRYQIKEIGYVPGKFLYLADTLSRAYLSSTEPDIEDDVVMIHHLQLEESAKQALHDVYSQDDTLSELKSAIMKGWHWPTRKQVPASIQPFWNFRDELYLKDEMVYRAERLVIPESQRRYYLRRLHVGHLGMDKCIERAKQCVFWPGIDREIRQLVSECSVCLKHSNRQQHMPLIPHEIPTLPWNKVGMDILEFQNRSYIVVVDFYSHYPELRMIKGKTARDVIGALKSIFAVHGVPVDVVADNMPFGSEAIKQFSSEWGFNVTTSSPHYPRSNGMAERYVQTVKQFLKKAADSESDIFQSLLAYRQTPVAGLPYSPSEMLFSRCIRGPLPYTEAMLEPRVPRALETFRQRQDKQKELHDRRVRDLRPLKKGSRVLVRTDKKPHWTEGKVVAEAPEPRSYVIDTGSNQLRRNRTHLKPAPATGYEQETARCESDVTHGATIHNDMNIPASPIPATPTPTIRRSARQNQGDLPKRFEGFDMN